ncbi:MAG: C-terminal binding protein [Dehalococcoidales bacterium]
MSFTVVSGIGGGKDIEAELAAVDAELVIAPVSTEEDLVRSAGEADAVMVGATEPYTRWVIEHLSKCRVISRTGIGYNNIDVDAATEEGIAVAIVPDASIDEVSDHAVALLLAFSRKLVPVDRLVRQGAWQMGRSEIFQVRRPTYRLTEQTAGVVGAGRIGSVFVGKARAFGLKVLVCDPYLSAETIAAMGAEKVDFERLLVESDFISLHCPANEETRHMFAAAEFAAMKPAAVLINTGRGELIDEPALCQALSTGQIAGAGLDVTDPEPPDPENPLLQLDNVIVTAHSAFYSETSLQVLRSRTVEAVVAALNGKWPRALANPEVKDSPNRRID